MVFSQAARVKKTHYGTIRNAPIACRNVIGNCECMIINAGNRIDGREQHHAADGLVNACAVDSHDFVFMKPARMESISMQDYESTRPIVS